MATGLSYTVGAAFPVLPYLLPVSAQLAFTLSIAFTLLALFFAGALKTRVTAKPFFRSGLEPMGIGALATGATYLAGRLVAG